MAKQHRTAREQVVKLIMVVSLVFALTLIGCSDDVSSKINAPDSASPTPVITPGSKTPTTSSSTPTNPDGYHIAFSNSYIGNHWRAETVKIFEAYTKKLIEKGVLASAYATSSGNDSLAQINEIKYLIKSGYDAIIVNAASPTSLVEVLTEATAQGIVVVTFDNTVDCENVYCVNTDQVEYGRLLTQWLVDTMEGKGNVLRINGITGTSVSRDRGIGIDSVLKNYPDIHVLDQGDGKWDNAATATLMRQMLSSFEGVAIDGILNEGGGESAIYEALISHGLSPKKIPMTGEMSNGFFRHMQNDGVIGFAVGQPPYMVAESVDIALRILSGEKVPQNNKMDIPYASYKEATVYYYPEQSDSFLVAYTNRTNSYGLEVEDIAPKF